jgi:hypothetical protein
MKKIILLTIVGFVMAGAASGQDKLGFRSTEWAGLGSGQVGNALQLQTVNGVYRGPWFVGAGVGLDWYRLLSMPLFLSVTREISFGKREGLFLFANGGTNIPLRNTLIPAYPYDAPSDNKWHPALYLNAGFGYEWKLGEHTDKAILVSVGYVEKKLTETNSGITCPYCQLPGPIMASQQIRYEFLNRAYQFMVGFRW